MILRALWFWQHMNKVLLSISDQYVRDNVNYRAFTDLALTGTSIADSKVAQVFSNSTSPNPMLLWTLQIFVRFKVEKI